MYQKERPSQIPAHQPLRRRTLAPDDDHRLAFSPHWLSELRGLLPQRTTFLTSSAPVFSSATSLRQNSCYCTLPAGGRSFHISRRHRLRAASYPINSTISTAPIHLRPCTTAFSNHRTQHRQHLRRVPTLYLNIHPEPRIALPTPSLAGAFTHTDNHIRRR